MIAIPEGVAKPTEDGEIPAGVAEIITDQEEPEASLYVISFAKYNQKMCEIDDLDSNKAKRAISVFKTIGTEIRSQGDFTKKAIDRIPIRFEGEYKKLFNGLDDDVELKEIKLQQDARIFYFDIESQRTFFVVAITQNHLETKKIRR